MSETLKKIAVPVLGMNVNNYINALNGVGVCPVVIHEPCAAADFDGLLLPGGGDILPARYGEETLPECGPIEEDLDELQWAVLDSFVSARKPVFGICRGHQVLNVYFGGSLYQHIDNAAFHARDAEFLNTSGNTYDKVHGSIAEPGSVIEKLYGSYPMVNSSHHQAVKNLAKGFTVLQSASDGIVEAMVHNELPILSLQWHPERMSFAYRRNDTVDGKLILEEFFKRI